MQFVEDLSSVDWASLTTEGFDSMVISQVDFLEAHLLQIKVMEQQVEKARDILTAEARQCCAHYHLAHKDSRSLESKEGRGFFGTRVRRVDGSLSMIWYRNRIVNTKQGPKTYSNHLKKGQGFRYPKSAFRGAKKWEMEIIEATEDRYALIRERWSYLTVILRELSKLRRSLKKQKDGLPDFSFLEEESSSDTETSVLEKPDDDVLRNEPIPDSV